MMANNRAKQLGSLWLALLMGMHLAVPASAASFTAKDEAVYVNLHHDGTVDSIYVVNSFEQQAGTTIVDRGRYASVTNLTTTEEIQVDGDVLTVTAPEGKFYFEGELDSKAIPWDIGVTYTLDGVALSGQELAGKSGSLEIAIDIAVSSRAEAVYGDNYAVQISLALDGDKTKNIQAPDATTANAGANKQLSYIVLPGNDKRFLITADVTDFENDGISFNMVPMSFGIDTPDTEEIKDKLRELQDGAVELDDGVQELLDGVEELDDGVADLDEGVLALKDGVKELVDGVDELVDGVVDLREGTGDLLSGVRKIKRGTGSMETGIDQLADGAKSFGKGLDELDSQSATLTGGSAAIAQGLTQIAAKVNAFVGEGSDPSQDPAAIIEATIASLDQLILQYEATLAGLSIAPGGAVPIPATLPDNGSSSGTTESAAPDEGGGAGEEQPATEEEDESSPPDEDASTEEAPSSQEQAPSEDSGEPSAPESAVRYQVAAMSDPTAELGLMIQGTIEMLQNLKMQYMAMAEVYSMMDALPELAGGINELATQYATFDTGLKAYTDGIGQLSSAFGQISDGMAELKDGTKELGDGMEELVDGVEELYDGTNDLEDGVFDLADGTVDLYDGVTELKDGTFELKDGTFELLDGVIELKDGTYELRTETADMDSEIDEEIDKLLDEYRNDDFEPVSFVSSGNKNVNLVQFIMQTASIKIEEEPEPLVEEEPEATLWQRFLNLFSFLKKG